MRGKGWEVYYMDSYESFKFECFWFWYWTLITFETANSKWKCRNLIISIVISVGNLGKHSLLSYPVWQTTLPVYRSDFPPNIVTQSSVLPFYFWYRRLKIELNFNRINCFDTNCFNNYIQCFNSDNQFNSWNNDFDNYIFNIAVDC